MSRRVDFKLTNEQVSEIEYAMNHSPLAEVRQRATAIRLLHLGHHPDAVAEMLAVKGGTIWTWHRRWRQGGLEGLANQSKSGRPAKADAEYRRLVEELSDIDPQQLGLSFNVWTINRMRLYLKERTGILLSYSRFRALLSQMGYVWRSPKHDLSKLQEPSAQAVAEEVLTWLKKTSTSPTLPLTSFSLWTKRP